MSRSVLALLIVLAGCGSNIGNPASRVQLPTAKHAEVYPITKVPRTPDPLPPSSADLEHYRGKGHSAPSMRLAQATISQCPQADPGTPFSIPPSTAYALAFDGPEDFDLYRVTVGGVQQPWAGVLLKSGPVVEGGCYTWRTSGTFLSPRTPGTYDVALTTLTADLLSESLPATMTLIVTQTTGCSYQLSAPGQSFTATGGSGNVAVTASDPSCAWASLSGASWLTVTAGGGTGSGSLTFTVAPNTATVGRTGTLTIAGQTFTVSQAGVPTVDQCAIPLGAETPSVFVTRWTISGSQVSVAYQLASKSPILEIQAKVDGQLVRRQGGTDVDLTWDGGLWIPLPAKGIHKLSVWVRNQAGCQREALSPVDLRVK